jgi:hypothetical protein
MTSICPGSGPSAAKSWVSPLFLVPAGAAANYIGNAGGVWASVLAAVIGAKTYDAATHCSTDPPGWPAAFTANEMLDLTLNILGTADWISGAAKVNQILDNVLWYLLCECTGAATPAQPAFPPAPAGLPTPGAATLTPSSRLCVTVTPPLTGAGWRDETSQGAADLSPGLLPNLGAQSTLVSFGGFNTVGYATPSPLPTYVRTTADFTSSTRESFSFWIGSAGSYGTNGALTHDNAGHAGVYHADSGLVALPAGTNWAITAATQSGSGTPAPATYCVEIYGAANPSGLTCCPPDPTTQALLRQILGTLVPLQRYQQPFAVVPGATHGGLTGTGAIAIPQCVGVAISVTAYPASNFVSDGNPPYVWDMGWISVSETGGMIIEKRLSQTSYTWLPEHMALADHFNYFLRPGVTISVQELYAET